MSFVARQSRPTSMGNAVCDAAQAFVVTAHMLLLIIIGRLLLISVAQ